MDSLRQAIAATGLSLLTACTGATQSRATHAAASRSPATEVPRGAQPAAAHCPSRRPLSGGRAVSVDYADFVFHDGVTFLNTSLSGGPGAPVALSAVGPVLFQAACEYSEFTASGRVKPPPMSEAASGFLPAGTAVHVVRGFGANCRLTAQRQGRWVAYLAQREVAHVSATRPCALRPN